MKSHSIRLQWNPSITAITNGLYREVTLFQGDPAILEKVSLFQGWPLRGFTVCIISIVITNLPTVHIWGLEVIFSVVVVVGPAMTEIFFSLQWAFGSITECCDYFMIDYMKSSQRCRLVF